MKNQDEFEFSPLKVPIIVLAIAILFGSIIASANSSQWNDGYCSCGGRWVYQEAVGHRYSTSYIYKCDKCGKIKEFYFEEMQK